MEAGEEMRMALYNERGSEDRECVGVLVEDWEMPQSEAARASGIELLENPRELEWLLGDAAAGRLRPG